MSLRKLQKTVNFYVVETKLQIFRFFGATKSTRSSTDVPGLSCNFSAANIGADELVLWSGWDPEASGVVHCSQTTRWACGQVNVINILKTVSQTV